MHVALGAMVVGGGGARGRGVLRSAVRHWEARRGGPAAARGGGRQAAAAATRRRSARRDPARYVALTKPRIIELLLVTTVPAMVLATREVPGLPMIDWARLTFWTLVCGTLAAGARQRDQPVPRARHRQPDGPDATPALAGERGHARAGRRRSGSSLGAVSVALMAWTVNLLAAFLTLLAIGFYVVVYTIMLKRERRPRTS